MKEYFISIGLSLFIIFFTNISFYSATRNTNAWKKFTFKKQKLINSSIGIIFFLVINFIYFINNDLNSILLYIVGGQFVGLTTYIAVLNVIAFYRKKEMIKSHIKIIMSKYPDIESVHEIMKKCILEFDIVYTDNEIERYLNKVD